MEREDTDPACDCAVETVTDPQSGRQVIQQNQIVRKLVFSQKHGTLMPLVQCVKCGDMNVKPAPTMFEQRIARMQQAHSEALRQGARRHGT
nr:hypothetical protein [uncultured bacterium]